MDLTVEEMYVSDGFTPRSKNVLTLLSDGSVHLVWYYDGTKIERKNVSLVRCLKGMKVEFGEADSKGIKSSLELLDYDTGELLKEWERIK